MAEDRSRRYRYRLWCNYCAGEGPDGCFGGGSEVSEETYATREEAEAAAAQCCRSGGPWGYAIEECEAEKDTAT